MSCPVIIVGYDSQYPILYENEKRRILEIIGHKVMAIEHIGSTAIPGLGGKPIIDIMAGVSHYIDADECVSLLHDDYKDVTSELRNPEWYYCLGKPCKEESTYYIHLHLVKFMSDHWKRHLLFRDFLRTHSDIAKQYYELKKKLAVKHGSNRIGYTDAKASFIESVIIQAR